MYDSLACTRLNTRASGTGKDGKSQDDVYSVALDLQDLGYQP